MAVRVLEGKPHPLTPSPLTRRGNRNDWSPVVTLCTPIGAALITLSFFLPWLQGDGVFAMRTYSGFGLAGALHNDTTGLATSGGGFVPMLFYALPAAAIGVAVYAVLSGSSTASRVMSLVVGGYALAVVAGVLVLALTPVTDATRVLGAPSWGLGLTMLGGLVLLLGSIATARVNTQLVNVPVTHSLSQAIKLPKVTQAGADHGDRRRHQT